MRKFISWEELMDELDKLGYGWFTTEGFECIVNEDYKAVAYFPKDIPFIVDIVFSRRAISEELFELIVAYARTPISRRNVSIGKSCDRYASKEAEVRELWESERTEILKDAEAIINGERQQSYGKPEDNFRLIADLWSSFLGEEITPLEVPQMMILLKLARTRGKDNRDNYVDIAGYAACSGEIYSKMWEDQ